MYLLIPPASLDDLVSAVGLGFLAAKFATEPGRYPEFVAWCNTAATVEDASWLLAVPPDLMQELAASLGPIFAGLTQVKTAQITVKVGNDQV
jgi:hypothetical protein